VPIGSLVGGSLAGLSDSGTGEVSLEEEGAASLVDIEEVQRRVRELAQSRLDALDTGLLVSSVIAVEPYPPQRVLAEFRAVDRAISEARTAVERAEREAAGELVRAAGPDYETYLELIDLYEDRVDSGDGAGAEEVLSAIHAAMAGGYEDRELVIGDRSFGEIAARGRATSVIREAESYVTTILRRAEAEHRTFLVKLAQMRENPSVFFARERADAMIALFEGDGMQVETFLTPDLEDFQLMINDDPEIRRRVERLRNQLQRTEAMERREREALGDR
jgi:hypothetical protein